MCLAAVPMLAIQTALSVAGAAASYMGQRNAAQAQEVAAKSAYNTNVTQLQEQRRQQGVQQSTEMSQRAREAMVERSRLRAASAEGGLGGASVDRIMGANQFALGQDLAMMGENSRNASRQSSMEATAMGSQLQSRLNAIERPSLINTGLQIAGVGTKAWDQYQKIK